MAFNVTSSVLGVDLNNASATQLFTLGQRVTGSDDSEWVYCIATGTLIGGQFASVQAAGTAVAPTMAYLLAPTGVAGGGPLCVTQCTALQGQYFWGATRGNNLVVLCSGTLAPAAVAYLGGDTAGALSSTSSSGTMAGIFLTTSASTAGLVQTGRAILTYPRAIYASATPLQ